MTVMRVGDRKGDFLLWRGEFGNLGGCERDVEELH